MRSENQYTDFGCEKNSDGDPSYTKRKKTLKYTAPFQTTDYSTTVYPPYQIVRLIRRQAGKNFMGQCQL